MSHFEVQLEVSEQALDQEYKHLHHAEIFRLLERGRYLLLEYIGQPDSVLRERDLFIVLSGVTTRFLREIGSEAYTVTCENPKVEGRKIFIEQRILNQNGKEMLTAVVEMMMLSQKQKRAVVPPQDFIDAICQISG